MNGNLKESKAGKGIGAVYDFMEIIVQSLIIIFIIFTFIFRIVGVNGVSMEPNLKTGNWLYLSNIGYTPSQGDIVVTTQPNMLNKPLIKRVIATGGQTIDIDFVSGTVTVDGTVLEEDYIKELTRRSYDVEFPHTVPEGFVFLMGDNRNESIDSRSTTIGDIDERYIIGQAKFRIFPFGQWTIGS